VMVDLWAVSILVVYYIVTSRNKGIVEVCAHMPGNPTGFFAVVLMYACAKSLLALAQFILKHPEAAKPQGRPLRLPGGNTLWGTSAGISAIFWVLLLYFHSPQAIPTVKAVSDVNRVLQVSLPVVNQRLHGKIPESAGNCEELWLRSASKLMSRQDFDRRCRGKKPLAHVTHRRMSGEASWATGINSLEILDITLRSMDSHKSTGQNSSGSVQRWNLAITGHFKDLHVWLKVNIGNKPWIDDYMCCNNPFNFALLATADCISGVGFQPVQLKVVHLDRIEFQHQVDIQSSRPGDYASYQINYGNSQAVEKAIHDFLTMKTGHIMLRNPDGSVVDPLEVLGSLLRDITLLNTGHQCVPSF